MKHRIGGWRSLALAALICSMVPASAYAGSFNFSYKFGGGTVHGSFDGSSAGDVIRDIRNVSISYNGFNLGTMSVSHDSTVSKSGDHMKFDFGHDWYRVIFDKDHDYAKLSFGWRKYDEHFDRDKWDCWDRDDQKAVPEPSAALVFAAGVGVIAAGTRKRR